MVSVLLLTGCNTAGGSTDTLNTDHNTDPLESVNESETEPQKEDTSYQIIYPQEGNKMISSLATKIKDDMNKKVKNTVKIKSDTVKAREYEILLGHTNREESQPDVAAGNAGWWVKTAGNKIIINAMTIQGMLQAVDYFLEHYTMGENGAVSLSENLCKVQYAHDDLLAKGITLRVGTYNIKHGEQVGLDMSVIANDIKALNLDIVGLQEVDVGTNRVGGIDTVREIAESGGYEYYYFCKAIDYQGGGYGTAILSRYPIKSAERIELYTDPGMEGRAVGHAVIDVDGVEIDYYNTHLSFEKASVAQKQFEQLGELTKDKKVFLITADFNTGYYKMYESIENSLRVNNGYYATFPSGGTAIDDIVVNLGWSVKQVGKVSGHSDHDMLWAELCYDGGMK